ncbi:MAG TPA: class I SAM-dependent methyltransferase [Streptosporangiaceae bacterium]|nr:class I SAM-dependent methyltransferase [Streptosporangiaceae bacterium]
MDVEVGKGHGHEHRDGATLDRVRLNEVVTHVAFLGRRRRVYRRIAEISAAHQGERVLDVGCGGGYLARLLAVAVGEEGSVTGVDPSAAAIEYATRKAPGNCEFTVGVAQRLNQPDEAFDLVTSTLAVHHIPADARPAAFQQLYRVLRPGGRLLVADFRPGGRRFSLHGRGQARRHGAAIPLDDLVTAAGFRIEGDGELPLLRYVRAVRD